MRTITRRVAPTGPRRLLLRLAPATLVALGALAGAHHLASRPSVEAASTPVAATVAAPSTPAPAVTVRKAVGYDPRVTATDSMQALTATLPAAATPQTADQVFDPSRPAAGGLVPSATASAILHRRVGALHVDPMPTGVTLASPTDTGSLYARSGAVPQTPADLAAPTAASPVPAGTPNTVGLTQHVVPSCSGSGTDGNRVQAMYVHEASTPSRYAKVVALLRNEIANVDDVFAVSSRKTGGDLRVRWVHDASCQPVILDVALPDGSLSSFDSTMSAMFNLGYNSRNRKYLMFTDADDLCGIATLYPSDAATGNPNDGGYTGYARVDVGCWSTVNSVAAHELTHNLGGVQRSAPHSTPYGHCTDESDLMCYADGANVTMKQVCPASQEDLLDCNNDDYFNTHPASGSYLATHWNVARSSFLDNAAAPARPAVRLTPSQTSAQTGDAVTLTAATDVSGVAWTWTSSSPGCTLTDTSTSKATLTCPATVTGPVTVTSTATALTSKLAGGASTTVQLTRAAAPTATLAVPATATVGTPFTVAVSPGGKAPYTYAWDVTGPCAQSSATAAGPTVSCGAAGAATVSVTVRQNDGQAVTAGPAAVTVSAATAPAARATTWSTPARVGGTPLRFTATLRDTGTGAALAGLQVGLEVLRTGTSTWTAATTGLTTGADGAVTAGPSGSTAGSYRFVFAGTADHAATTSSTVLVKQGTALRARTGARRGVVVGQLTTLTGQPVPGASIRLETQAVGSLTWTLVLRRTTGSDGTVRVQVRAGPPRYYRWVFAGDANQANALSDRVRLG